jgi:hypothetical protein
MGDMRVVFYVRCHGKPDDELEEEICKRLGDAVEIPDKGWGILTIGRRYYHDLGLCGGHTDADNDFCVPDVSFRRITNDR